MLTAVTASTLWCLPLLLWEFIFHSHTQIVAIKLNSISYRRDSPCGCPSKLLVKGAFVFWNKKMTEGVLII